MWTKEEKSKYNKEYRDENQARISKQKKEYYILFPWKQTIKTIRKRCNNPNATNYKYYGGKGIECRITVDELEFLWFRDKAYEMVKPSISRKNHNKNYTLNNCKYEEKSNNIGERNKRILSKTILQFAKDGEFIREWNSAYDIERELKLDNGNINRCCLGKNQTCGGFRWRFK